MLVIDDDEGIRTALGELLEDAGFATTDARHGREALEVLTTLQEPPAFILLDLMMPVMDGWTFCHIRETSKTLREIPVVAISAAAISAANRPAGIDAFLSKPIDVENFAWLAVRMAGRKSYHDPEEPALH
ncbi:MAG TPA: response regulator [Polyangia bacterium]|nr:response regulator [Polyangia bacterium]